MVLDQGDLGYEKSSATDFMNAVNDVLGPDFPYFAARGNHDRGWEESYQPILAQRAKEVGAVCIGDYGQNSACKYRRRYSQGGLGLFSRHNPSLASRALISASA